MYWTTSASTQTHAYVVVRFGHAKFGLATEFGRALLRPIRLASRSELFGCSVDGVGLLFLPAAGSVYPTLYTTVSGRGVSDSWLAFLGSAKKSAGVSSAARYNALTLRLASRSEFSGCSVVGVSLLFLPAGPGSLWTISTTNNYGDGALGSIRGRISDPLVADARQKPCNRFGIRLASREDCPLWCRC